MVEHEDGYTLLEVLVATALMALIALPLTDALRLGIGSWFEVHAIVDVDERDQLLRRRLREWISSSYPGDVYLLRRAPFSGSAEQMNFIAPIHPDGNSDDMYAVTLKKCDTRLMAAVVPNFAVPEQMDELNEIIESSIEDAQDASDEPSFLDSLSCEDDHFFWIELLSGIAELSFSYQRKDNPTIEGVWQNSWDVDQMNIPWTRMPRAVAISVSFKDATISWTPLWVPLLTEDQAYCEPNSDSAHVDCVAGANAG